MQLAELQSVATNIVVISVALLAVTIVIFSSAWQGFLRYIGLLSLQGRRDIRNILTGFHVASLVVYGSLIAMSIVGPDLVQTVIFLAVLAIDILGIGYLAFTFIWNIVWHRRLPKFRPSREPDVEEWEKSGMLFYSTAMFNLALATFSFTISVVGAIDTTAGTGIRLNPAEDVDFSRWTLSAGTMTFFLGLMLLGAGKYVDLYRFLDSKRKSEEVLDSTSEDHGPTDQDQVDD